MLTAWKPLSAGADDEPATNAARETASWRRVSLPLSKLLNIISISMVLIIGSFHMVFCPTPQLLVHCNEQSFQNLHPAGRHLPSIAPEAKLNHHSPSRASGRAQMDAF